MSKTESYTSSRESRIQVWHRALSLHMHSHSPLMPLSCLLMTKMTINHNKPYYYWLVVWKHHCYSLFISFHPFLEWLREQNWLIYFSNGKTNYPDYYYIISKTTLYKADKILSIDFTVLFWSSQHIDRWFWGWHCQLVWGSFIFLVAPYRFSTWFVKILIFARIGWSGEYIWHVSAVYRHLNVCCFGTFWTSAHDCFNFFLSHSELGRIRI